MRQLDQLPVSARAAFALVSRRALLARSTVRRAGSRGLSLLEVTIAGALVLVIAVGILPMMVRSTTNNQLGWQATEMSNHFRSIFDEAMEASFSGAAMTIPDTDTSLLSDWVFTAGALDESGDADERWWSVDDPGLAITGTEIVRGAQTNRGPIMWVRRTQVRQFNIEALGDPNLPGNVPFPDSKALQGSTLRDSVHLKEIRVEMTKGAPDGATDAFDRAPRYSILMYKAF